jgi:hypothetical protein
MDARRTRLTRDGAGESPEGGCLRPDEGPIAGNEHPDSPFHRSRRV